MANNEQEPRKAAGVFKREVRYPLTEEEWHAAAKRQAELHMQREALKDERREAMAGFKQRFAGIDEVLTALVEEVEKGERVVQEDHERVLHPERPVWQIVRLADHQIVDEEPMNADDWLRERNRPELPLHQDPEQQPPQPDDRPNATVLPFSAPATNADGGSGDADAASKDAGTSRPARSILCPYVLAYAEDPRHDDLCGAKGTARHRGFCDEHYEAAGGKDGGEVMVKMLMRRGQRSKMIKEAEKAAQAAAAGGDQDEAEADDSYQDDGIDDDSPSLQ